MTTPVTVERIVGRFDERAQNEIPGISNILYNEALPQEVLDELYRHVDTCEFNQLSVLGNIVGGPTTGMASFLSGYLAAVELTHEVMRLKSNGRGPLPDSSAVAFGAYGSIKKSFEMLGFDDLNGMKALLPEQEDLLCAEILAGSVNIFRDKYHVIHDYHVRLEAIRNNIVLIKSLLPEFLRLRTGKGFSASVSGAIAALKYIDIRGRQYSDLVVETYIDRFEFDAEVLDLLIANPATAVSEGVL